MEPNLGISLFGELRVTLDGAPVALPASRKARALLAFLVATGRPHRRERLCELFWSLPDDPKAALRWSLTKLRKVVDTPLKTHIVADRERVSFDPDGVWTDLGEIETRLKRRDLIDLSDLETMEDRLSQIFLDGLDGVGDPAFDTWLTVSRHDARTARVLVLERLVSHPAIGRLAAEKWLRIWQSIDPVGVEAYRKVAGPGPATNGASGEPASAPQAETAPEHPARTPLGDVSLARQALMRAGRPQTLTRRRALRAQRIGFCTTRDGTKIAYATIGEGPPILKTANWLNHLEFDWASPIWGRSFEAVSRQRTFIRYDERGCGLSDWDVDDLSFDAFVDDLEAVADALALERFPLLGVSQGCAVSIEYAVRHPERVSGLILVGGYAAGWRISASAEEQARREAVMELTKLGWGTDNPAYRHIFSQTFMPEASAADLAWFDEFQRQTTSPENAARFQDAFGYIDVRDRLAAVQAPTIVLHSRDDQRIPLEQGRAIAAGIKNARFVPLDSRNHILLDREPAWKVCFDAVRRFIVEHGI
ncbi:alpha/beta fold hydrolase [Acuticoccus sp. M5D2P5]|uniref:alpha/beta hydrolase n=1 Tax=Acuticoccus kalidii TaxID=2910977 RepID=UPI001F35F0D0|nr:alpha/beta hydrolase [Acuticoccus kalidii]MCF3934757.1 alpha/beta fold hydrolase [Acuticoccus kalidii]